MERGVVPVDNLFVQLLGGILVTAIGYLAVPFVLRTSRGKYEPQKAKKIALWNSIIVGACFCIASADKGVAWSAGPAFLYYWINCSILTDKNAANTSTAPAGHGAAPANYTRPPVPPATNARGGNFPATTPVTPSHSVNAQSPAAKPILFCRKCGSKLSTGYMFCSKCGTKISSGNVPKQ